MNKDINRNKIRLIRILLLLAFTLFFALSSLKAQSKMWVNAYYAGWMQGQNNDGYLTTQNIDFSAVTQIIHFSLVPNADGTLDAASNSITAANSSALISAAHAAGVKVLICVGGWNSESNFLSATSSSNLSTFVNNLVSFMQSRGYDGIDIDWETLSSSDASQYSNFIVALRNALNQISPRPLLTAATAWQPGIFASLTSDFDEINLMTYDFSGAWQGWVTWHNSAIYDGGVKFPSTGDAVPSINGMVSSFTSAGVPASKLGIGMDFYGYVWSGGAGTPTGGVTAPDQSWTTAPTVQANIPYYQIMDQYYTASDDKWDSGAQAAYISVEDNTNSGNDKFISYDNATTAQYKVNYVKNNGLGGMIIWELGAGYRADMPAGQQQPLLEAIKAAVGGGTVVSNPDTTPPTVSFASPANGSTVSGSLNISINASDNVGVASVSVSVDGSILGSLLTSSPFSILWNTVLLSNGSHTITAIAKDAAGNSATATETVTVSNNVVDNIAPVVSITLPANGSTVSGTINITANATDNVGVASVAISVDGTQEGGLITTSPYSVSLNTATLSNGSHTITAVAKDAAGNSSTATDNVVVSNTVAGNPGVSDLFVYQDNLSPSWTNTSWGLSTNYTSTQPVYQGSDAMKVNQNAWGALRLLSGSWSNLVPVDPTKYQNLQFAIYGENSGLNISVYLDGSSNGNFPTVNYGSVPVNQWTVINIPLSSLDPGNISIKDLVIADVSGNNLTYDIDNLKFTGAQTIASFSGAPLLLTPSNNQTGIESSPTLVWSAISGAASYHVKVSTDQSFAAAALDKAGVADTTLSVSGLNSGTTYYWEVAAVNSSGIETESQVFSFTTGSSSTATASLPVYTDGIASPWINTSWNATVNFSNAQTVYQGTNSIQVNQTAWGGLSLHYGDWGTNNTVSNSTYNELQFAVFSTSALNLNVMFENDASSSFPSYNYGTVPANIWTVITIPLSQLNPNNNSIQRLDIMEMSGNNVTYYVDNISFIYSTIAKQLTFNNQAAGVQPDKFALDQNFPNPFNPSTTIQFSLASPSHVTLNIYNILGQKIANLIDQDMGEGIHSVNWNADNLPSGFYIYQLKAGSVSLIKKMELLK